MDIIDIASACSAVDNSLTFYRDKRHLDTNFPASKIIGREKEGKQLASLLANWSIGGSLPTMIAVRGKSGTGKTTVVRYVCDNLPQMKYAMVNLRLANTALACINAILKEMGAAEVKSARGLSGALAALAVEVEGRLSRGGDCKVFTIVLDDFDTLRRTGVDISDLINRLNGMVEELRKRGHLACVIAIMNEDNENFDVDERIISRISASILPFTPYSPADITAILKDRAEKALYVRVPEDVFSYCAALDENMNCDARRAIHLLRTSCEIALENGGCSWKLDNDHVYEACHRIDVDSGTNALATLPARERTIAGIIAWRTKASGNVEHSTKQLFDHYLKDIQLVPAGSFKMGYRQFSESLNYLERQDIVASKIESKGRGSGIQRCYQLKLPTEIVGQKVYGPRWQEIERCKKEIEEMKSAIVAASSNDMLDPAIRSNYIALCNQKCEQSFKKLLLDD